MTEKVGKTDQMEEDKVSVEFSVGKEKNIQLMINLKDKKYVILFKKIDKPVEQSFLHEFQEDTIQVHHQEERLQVQ